VIVAPTAAGCEGRLRAPARHPPPVDHGGGWAPTAEQVLGPVAARIEQFLLAEKIQHQQALDKAMNSRRYLALMTESARWVTDPPFTELASKNPAALKGAVQSAARRPRPAARIRCGR